MLESERLTTFTTEPTERIEFLTSVSTVGSVVNAFLSLAFVSIPALARRPCHV